MKADRRELITYAILGILAGAAYFVICHTISAPREVVMPAWVPFLPVLTIPYLLQVVVSYLLVLGIRSRSLRRACWGAYFASYAVVCAVWFFAPTIMHRPPAPAGWWNWPFSVMASIDLPVNIVPAGHILMPVLLIWAYAVDRPGWLWWLVPAELLGTVAIVTTWQHRPVDVAVGAVLAAVAGLVFKFPLRQKAS